MKVKVRDWPSAKRFAKLSSFMPDPSFITTLLITYHLWAIFWGAFFFGETVIITAAFLAGSGWWSLATVFWLALAGTVISDVGWFFAGRYIASRSRRWADRQARHGQFLARVDQLFGQRPFLVLLFIKFLYGTRILTIIYLSLRKVPLALFILFDTIGTIIWLAVMLTIGWLASQGLGNLFPILQKTEYALSLLVVIIIGYKLVTAWIAKQLNNE